MQTIVEEMTGSPVAIAGAGEVTFTGTGLIYWWFDNENVVVATRPGATHRARSHEDKSMLVPTGTNLWVQGTADAAVAVSRDTAPVLP